MKLEMEIVGVTDFKKLDFIKQIKDPNKIIINDKNIFIKFDYLVKKELLFKAQSKEGFTKLSIYKHIYEGYVRLSSMGFLREIHHLDDLLIESIQYDPISKICSLHIGS